MCVLAFAWAAHPRWRLVLAGNRDEYHARPAAPLARWAEPYPLIAGRDLASGGTWLGVSEAGRLAVVTNLRGFGAPDPDRASRGRLVTDLLAGEGPYGDPQTAALEDFNPFNLIVADAGRATFLTNRPEPRRAALAHGLYGLSNGRLDEPWPKTMRLKEALLGWLSEDGGDPEGLFSALRETGVPPVGAAPDQPSEVAQEPPLSSIFIEHPVYGTRCSTVVLVDREGRGLIAERRFAPDGSATGDTRIEF
jgi:uncharacterized protein with NRDE domain